MLYQTQDNALSKRSTRFDYYFDISFFVPIRSAMKGILRLFFVRTPEGPFQAIPTLYVKKKFCNLVRPRLPWFVQQNCLLKLTEVKDFVSDTRRLLLTNEVQDKHCYS